MAAAARSGADAQGQLEAVFALLRVPLPPMRQLEQMAAQLADEEEGTIGLAQLLANTQARACAPALHRRACFKAVSWHALSGAVPRGARAHVR